MQQPFLTGEIKMTVKYEEYSYAIYPKTGSGFDHKHTKHNDKWCKGKASSVWVETPFGYVCCSSNSNINKSTNKKYESTRLDIIKDGRMYFRYFNKFYTPRGLVTKAKQFANDLYNQQENIK